MTISDVLLICSTFLGPIAAVQAQKWIERSRERRNRRLTIFQTLMATRAIRASSNEHVQALNLIDVFFEGASEADKAVRNAWHIYLDFFNQPVPAGENSAQVHNEKGIDLLVDLLAAMAKSLNYNFNKVELKRGGYYPRGPASESTARRVVIDNLAKMLEGGKPIPMAVVSLPVSEEALKGQMQVQEAILKTLSGEQPLKIKSEP